MGPCPGVHLGFAPTGPAHPHPVLVITQPTLHNPHNFLVHHHPNADSVASVSSQSPV
ncbi:hypothetical protein CALCODRAFT_504531 [Calocera cornea HHB12733]|uniref:Uncharacterized protein n=1 Tax=Calocera cornea HHB12733 TaxID=1353952 RepID=A0A165CDD1_9BASI|nr:hypothetical protein CALCODRAFT_504531 [Calocera cornea HHB12733]